MCTSGDLLPRRSFAEAARSGSGALRAGEGFQCDGDAGLGAPDGGELLGLCDDVLVGALGEVGGEGFAFGRGGHEVLVTGEDAVEHDGGDRFVLVGLEEGEKGRHELVVAGGVEAAGDGAGDDGAGGGEEIGVVAILVEQGGGVFGDQRLGGVPDELREHRIGGGVRAGGGG